jgi:hypothetical protein
MVDDRKVRLRRNMARMWAFAAASYASSVSLNTNISWDLYGAPVGMAGGLASATLSTPPSSGPALRVYSEGPNIPNTASVTFSLSVGTASANRRIIFVVQQVGNAENEIPLNRNKFVSGSIGGVAITHIGGFSTTGGLRTSFYTAIVPTASQNVRVSMSFIAAGGTQYNTWVFDCDNALIANPSGAVVGNFSTSGAPVTASFTTSANGFFIVSGAAIKDVGGSISQSYTSADTVFTGQSVYQSFASFAYAQSATGGIVNVVAQCTASASIKHSFGILYWR